MPIFVLPNTFKHIHTTVPIITTACAPPTVACAATIANNPLCPTTVTLANLSVNPTGTPTEEEAVAHTGGKTNYGYRRKKSGCSNILKSTNSKEIKFLHGEELKKTQQKMQEKYSDICLPVDGEKSSSLSQ